MGKRKYQSQYQVKREQTLQNIQQGRMKKRVISFSTSNIVAQPQYREQKIIKRVKRAIKKICNRGKQQNKKKLMSALNIASEKEIICSAMNIPSIQHMVMSKNQLCSYEKYGEEFSDSNVSVIQSMSYCVIENQPELMLSYVCLIQKAINKLGIVLSSKQNQKLIMGIWNILVKFWEDDWNQFQYSNVNAKIQWGILQLLNYDLKVSKKQRVLMQSKIKSLNFMKF